MENGTWGEAGVLPWVLAAAGLPLPASLGSPVPLQPRLPTRVNVLPGCEQPVVPPSLQTPRGEGSAGATGAEPVPKRSPLFYLRCPPQGKQSTAKKGNLLRGGT